MRPFAAYSSSATAASAGASSVTSSRIFSGLTVNVPAWPRIAPAASPFEEVRGPDEPRHERGRRSLVDLGRGADLLDPAGAEHRDPVAHRERFLLVVGHVDERDPDLVLDLVQLDLHLLAQLEVERAEGLVEEQDARPVHERPRQRHALPLAAGELAGLAPLVAAQADHRERVADPALPLGLGDLPDDEAVGRRSRRRSCAGTARNPGTRC